MNKILFNPNIYKLFLSFIMLSLFSTSIVAQLNLEWQKEITTHDQFQYVNFSTIIDDKIVVNVIYNENNGTFPDSKKSELKVFNFSGEEIWSFDWNTEIPKENIINLVKTDNTNKLFFSATYPTANGSDYIGLITLFEGIEWIEPVEGRIIKHFYKKPAIAQINDNFLFLKKNTNANQLVCMSDKGYNKWTVSLSDTLEFNYLASNGIDKIIMEESKALYYINEKGQILKKLDRPDPNYLERSYLLTQKKTNILYHQFTFAIERSNFFNDNNFTDTLSHYAPIYGQPYTLLKSDKKDNLMVSGVVGYMVDTTSSFLVKYDKYNHKQWEKIIPSPIFNFHITDTEVFVLTATSIYILDNATGEINYEYKIDGKITPFLEIDFQYNSLLLQDEGLFYTFTKKDNHIFLSKYKDTTTGNHNTQSNFSIYPNPSSGTITIEGENLDISKIELFDILGQKQLVLPKKLNSGQVNLDLSAFTSGVYFILVNGEVQKVVLQ